MSVATGTALEAPFLGLRYFDEEHSHLFFGRDVQVNDILEKLRRSRLVTVMGSSGSGKSSLVRAGVVPRLKAGLLGEAGPRWRIAKMRPGSSPISSLARELEKVLAGHGLDVTLRRGPLGLIQAVEECRLAGGENVLVIADQFEELFRYQRESSQPEKAKEEAAAFVKLLLEATGQRAIPIYVVVTMRSDYLGNCAQFRDLPERINDGLYLVPRMRRDQLEQAIFGPAAVEDAEIASRLVQRLLNESGDDPDQLPVLQHALLRTWNAWNHAARPLDLEDLDAGGGMNDSLSRHADEIFQGLSSDQQRIARVVFQQLTERDVEGREIRRPAPVALVAAVAGATVPAVEQVVARFAAPEAAFLYRNEEGHLDITHESLIRKWSRMQGMKQGGGESKGWIQEEVDARDQFHLLVERAAKKDTLMGRALDDAIRWRTLDLNADWASRYTKRSDADAAFQDVLRFVEKCRAKDAARRSLRAWLVIGALALLSVFVLGTTLLWRSAERQKAAADEALARSSTQEAARLIAEDRPSLALAHLARALRSAPDEIAARSWISDVVLKGTWWIPGAPLQHQSAVSAAVFSPDGRRIVTAASDRTARVWDAITGQTVGAPLQHRDQVSEAAFSGDGRRIVTVSGSTAQVWDAATGLPVSPPLEHQFPVLSATFSPDGRRVVAASLVDTAQVWDAATGQQVGEPLQHQNMVLAAFSPDGRRIVTVSRDSTARVWDAATGAPLQHQGNPVVSAPFSAGGRYLVTVSADSTARMWDASTGEPVGAPLQQQNGVLSAVFSPDERRIVTVSADSTARVWDAATGAPVGATLRHLDLVWSAAFSPDGSRVVTASADDTARVWDAATGQPIGAPLQHQDAVYAAAFSPDGRRIVTGSGDNTARVWAAATGAPADLSLQHESDVNAAAFSPDGRRIVTASDDNTARVWDAATGQAVGTPLQHQAAVNSVAFSRDGGRVVTASGDKGSDLGSTQPSTARVWNAATGQPVTAPLQHEGAVVSAAFSPDGRRIITASDDNTARVWDAVTGQPVSAPLPHEGPVFSAVFSPDGRRIVTASADNTARVWDAATGQPMGAPLQHRDAVLSAQFRFDGRRIVTASNDQTARMWDADGQPVGAPLEHQSYISAAAFSPDGRRIVTASFNDTARVWDAATGQPLGARLQHQGPVHSVAFSPDGRRIVTASSDSTARIWDVATGQPVGRPLQHTDVVWTAAFSPDGHRIVTASEDSTARVWDVLLGSDSAEDAELLADLAEVVGGYRLTDLGSLVPLGEPERLQRVRRLTGPAAQGFVPLDVLLRRFRPTPR